MECLEADCTNYGLSHNLHELGQAVHAVTDQLQITLVHL